MSRGVVVAPKLLCGVCGYMLDYLGRGFRPPEWTGRAKCLRCDVVYTLTLPVIDCAMEKARDAGTEKGTDV